MFAQQCRNDYLCSYSIGEFETVYAINKRIDRNIEGSVYWVFDATIGLDVTWEYPNHETPKNTKLEPFRKRNLKHPDS